MLDTTKRTIATLTAAACLGGAGWAIASSSNGSSGSSASTESAAATDAAIAANATAYGAPPQQREVTGDAAAKITAAVLAEVPGATIERVEQDAQGYHAHITKSDGTRATVRVNAQFAVTAVEAGRGPGGPGQGGGLGGPCPEDGAQGGGGSGSSGESPAPAAAAGESGTSET